MKETLSIVIPVYNTVTSLTNLVKRIDDTLSPLGVCYEIIFVNDASPNPETWPHLEKLALTHKQVRVVSLMRNFGQQAATLCGFEHAMGDYILTMDDDLQHRPEEIPNLWEERSHDIVIGQFSRKHHSLFKRITSRLKGWFDHILIGKPKNIHLSSFRLLNRSVVDDIVAWYELTTAIALNLLHIPTNLLLQTTSLAARVPPLEQVQKNGRFAEPMLSCAFCPKILPKWSKKLVTLINVIFTLFLAV